MACYHPVKAYKLLNEVTENGKAVIEFDLKNVGNEAHEKLVLPCGNCLGCRENRSQHWALRCVHEASLYENNCFLTLTFNPASLNERSSLIKSDFQNFMKRFRAKRTGMQEVHYDDDPDANPFPIRFFHCGEYGDKKHRPHHHACIFNFDFADKRFFKKDRGVTLYTSKLLSSLWTDGFSTIGEVNFKSAAYLARYVLKKVNGFHSASHYIRWDEETGEAFYLEPEYITMSRRPGIGKGWYDKFKGDCYPSDNIHYKGQTFKPPAYYDKQLEESDPIMMGEIKKRRKEVALLKASDYTPAKLKARKLIHEQRHRNLPRELENADENVLHLRSQE